MCVSPIREKSYFPYEDTPMTINGAISELFPITSEQGKWYVRIPWNDADEIHAYLMRADCPSTLCLNPALHEASLELREGVDPNQVRAAFAAMGSNGPSDPTKKAA